MTHDMAIARHGRDLRRRIDPTQRAILSFVRNRHEALLDAKLLQLTPTFRSVEFVNSPAPVVILNQRGIVDYS